MRTGAIIYPLLSSYTKLTQNIPASKIFAVRALQGTQGPYIVYRELASTPTNTSGDSYDLGADPRIRQRSILDVYSIQISIFADTYLGVEENAVLVRQALDREWGTVPYYENDVSLDSCVYESCVDDYDDDYGERGIYIKHLDFRLRVNRINISNTFINTYSTQFDGVDSQCVGVDSAIYTPNTSVNGGTGFSISVWARFDADNALEWIIGKNAQTFSGTTYYEWDLYRNTDSTIAFRTFFNNTATNFVTFKSVETTEINTWYHIVVSYDGSQTSDGYNMYVNNDLYTVGNTKATVTLVGSYGNVEDTPSKLMVGLSVGSAVSMSGWIDEISIWGENLTATKVAALYNSGKCGSPLVAPTTSLYLNGYWRMGDGATFPNIPDDSQQYSNQLVMTNMVSTDITTQVP